MHQIKNKLSENCLFCKKEIANKSFYSSKQFRAIYNIAPILPGHTLVIPDSHYESLFELSDIELGDMMIFARKVTAVLKSVFQCEGFNWTIQDGVSAGQTVPHLHLHIIPRKPLDMPEGNDWYRNIPLNEKQMLDSEHREHLSDQDYMAMTAQLTEAARSINM